MVRVATENGKTLQEFSVNSHKGLNQGKYDLTITEKGKNILSSEYPDDDISIKKNGKYYLPIGKYQIEISDKKTTKKTLLKIE